jgi:hypothetical protein
MEVFVTLEVYACSACQQSHTGLTAKLTGGALEFSCPLKGEDVRWEFTQPQERGG